MKQIGFAQSLDGASISYRVYGNGSPTVFVSNGIGCHQVFVQYLTDALSQNYRVVTWHYRGHMDSPPPRFPGEYNVDKCIEDMYAVMEATNTKQAILAGFSMGVQLNFEFASRFPGRTLGIVALCGSYEYPLQTFYYLGPVYRRYFPKLLEKVKANPRRMKAIWKTILGGPWAYPLAGRMIYNRKKMRREDFDTYRPHFIDMDLEVFLELLLHLDAHTTACVMPKIKAPTLIIAGDSDNFTPLKVNASMHRMIPHSEMYVVKGGTHASLLEFPEEVNGEVLRFIRRNIDIKSSGASTRTLAVGAI